MADIGSGGFDNSELPLTFVSEKDSSIDFSYDGFRRLKMLQRMRTKIAKMERTQNYVSTIYRETLKTIIHMLGGFSYINSKNEVTPISCFHANPERAIAKIREKSNIILPVITISQTISENDDTRRRYAPTLVNSPVWNDKEQRAQRVLGFVERPVTIVYQIHIWAKYNADMDQITEQIRLMFNPSIEVPTKFSTLVKANLLEEEDSSTVDVGDAAERLLTKVLSVEVETYIPSPKFLITSTGKIESFNVEAELYKNS